jgi:hypothetical protein
MSKLFSLRWVSSICGSITLTCLLEPCSKCRFQFLQWRRCQWLPLLGERFTLDETSFSFLTVLHSIVQPWHRESLPWCQFRTCANMR